MFEKRDTELYIAVVIWLVAIAFAYSFWALGDESIISDPSTQNRVAAAFFFCLYLAGYFLSRGTLGGKQRERYKLFGILISAVALTTLSVHYFFFGMVFCMTMMTIMQLPSIIKQKRAIAVAVAYAVPLVLVAADLWLGKQDIEISETFVFSIANVLALIASYRATAEREAKLESENLVRELKATQLLLSAVTKRDERLRISRNLHDIMGHQLTALSLQLEVASHVEGKSVRFRLNMTESE